MSETQTPPSADPGTVPPEELASRLASRLCHDFINPASAIISGLDLLEDPTAKDMRDDAMQLITASAYKLVDAIAFARVAYGAAAGATAFDSQELERLTRATFAHVRPDLDWAIAPQSVGAHAGRILLNLAQLAAGALPLGGMARVSAAPAEGRLTLTVEAKGAKARLQPEVGGGLRGDPLGEGLGGRWVQAYYVHVLARAAGGDTSVEVQDEQVIFTATIAA